MGDDTEWMKLSTEDKVQHKAWKARIAGYEEATKLFQRQDDEKSPVFSNYAGLLKKFVTDSNAFAQEKGLEAVQAFVENAGIAPKTAHDVVNGIITKCLNSTKTKTKDLGKEIIMLYIEAEKQDVVEDDLIEALSNKNPKVVIGCIACLREGLRDFGNKIVQIKPMIKFLPKLIEDRDKNVREETKQLIVEIYRWIGPAIKAKMTDLKPVQVQELEAEFEKLGNEKPHQVRFLKSQQDLKAKMEEKAAAGDDGGDVDDGDDEGGGEAVDPYDLIDPVNILPMLPKDFYDKVEAKKWQERKEALEALHKLCENPKIEPGDFGPVVKVLMKVIGKDSNVMLVALGGKCLAGLANGLRKKFSTYAPSCFTVILEKFKEKKPMVVTALRDASDACYQSINLEVIMEDLLAALENKNPSIKAETALFLARCFCKLTMTSLPKKQLKAFCTQLLKTVNDTAPEVREASFDALGTAMKVVSEKNIAPFLVDVDNIKMQKIKEHCEKAVLLNAKGEPRSGSGGSGDKAAPGPRAGSAQPKPVAKPAAGKAPAAAAERPKTAPAKAGGPPRSKKGGPPKGKAAAKKGGGGGPEEKTEKVLSDDEFLEKASELLTPELMAQLENSNWKERLEGMEKFTKLVQGMLPSDIPCQICVRAVNKKPGLKETNFQVMKVRVDLICYLAQNGTFTNTTADFILSDLVDKVGDVKNGAACQEALSCIAEATSLEYVSSQVLKLAFAQKNPKNQAESLNWLAKAVTEFGLKVQVKQNIEYIKKAFGATNPAVRTAAISLLTNLYRYMGQQLRMFFEDEKAALLQQIDAEFEKVKGEKPPPPTRGLKSATVDDDEDKDEENAEEEVKMEDLVPRNDIGDRFTPDIITDMSDKNWKVRGEALQKVISILNEAKFITGNLGPLPEAIKARLGDANKNLVTTTIGICATLATNLGPHCKAHVKTIGPALIPCLGDTKPLLRSAAVGALNAWVDQTTLTPLVECEAFSDALKLENPNLRQELLGWLIERLPNHKQLPKDEMKLCIPHLLSCLEDRNGDVRKKAQEALVPFMIHVGYDAVFRAISKLKPASKDQITQIIEKARENLPAKQPKPKKASAPAAAPSAPPTKTVIPDDEEEEMDTGKKQKSSEQTEGKTTKGPGKTKAKAMAAPSKRKKVEEDTSPPITLTVTKVQRFKDEKNMKVLKWNFTEPRLEYVDQLKLQMEKNFSKSMMDNLFHSDFKFHTKAIETLIKCLDTLQNEQIGNLDLILKWFTLRFFDTNPSMLNKGLEYLQTLFTVLADIDYQLEDQEAQSFMPYLIIKVGEAKDNVRRDVRNLFKLIYKVYAASKMFTFISDGIKSKNSKQRTECLEELGYLIETYGITICQPSPGVALKNIASQISDRDNGVRNAALNSTVIAHMILGDNLYKYIGTLKEKDQGYLDERIKRSAKNRPPPGERPKSAPQAPLRSSSQSAIQRPHTASMPKSASSNAMVQKEFQLDIEDDKKPSNMEMPQLIQYHDLDTLLQPVELPKINARPPSPSPRFLNSADTGNTISFVISQVTNRDIRICKEALAQIEELIKDRNKVHVMTDHVEQLLVAMSMQFKIVYTTHMGDEDTAKEDIIQLYRVLLATLLSIFQNSTLATQASKDILKELLNNLVTVLLDDRLNELEDGTQIVRSVNVLIVKIVEKADQTNVLCALIKLLQECAESETCSHKFIDLNMKCLWKMVRMLPDIINELNLDRVLLDIHQFLRKFPSNSWKERPNDLPLRTIKTILHTLAKLKKSKILSHLGQIDAGEVSEVKSYLQKVLKSDGKSSNISSEAEVNGTEDNKNKNSSAKSRRLSKASHDLLTEIFKKVGSKENTKEGLQDLYDFKKKFPEADLEPYLKKASPFFQNYIERGLKGIENEMNEKNSGVPDGVRTSVQPLTERVGRSQQDGDVLAIVEKVKKLQSEHGIDSNKNADDKPGVEAGYYMERLRILRAKCGLDTTTTAKSEESEEKSAEPGKQDTDSESSSESQSEKLEPEEKQPPPPEQPAVKSNDVSKLKERLEKIKQMANS